MPKQSLLSADIKKKISEMSKTKLATESDKARIIEAWRLGANAKMIRELQISLLSEYHIKRIIAEAGETDNYGIDAEVTHD